MNKKIKRTLVVAVIAIVLVPSVITVIDLSQRRPLGATLDKLEITYTQEKDSGYDLYQSGMHVLSVDGINILTAQIESENLMRTDKPHDRAPLPGEILDLQVPERAEQLRERAKNRAINSATGLVVMGHTDLAAAQMMTSIASEQKRGAVARLTPDGRIVIDATIAVDYSPEIIVSPDKTLLLATGGPIDPIFTSKDQGRHWHFERNLEYNNVWMIHLDPTSILGDKSLEEQIWKDSPIQQRFSEGRTILVPKAARVRQGWSSRYDESTGMREVRRFEVALSENNERFVRNVERTDEPIASNTESRFYFTRSPDGGVLWNNWGELRYLSPTTWRWGPEINLPSIHGASSYVGTVYNMGDDIWVVKARASALWNDVACYVPFVLGIYRHCGPSIEAYFFSTDLGQHWTPFTLPDNDTQFPMTVVGVDTARHHLLVAHTVWTGSRNTTAINGYALPIAAK